MIGWKHFSVAISALAVACSLSAARTADTITVFAAASLTDVLQEIGKGYQAETGNTVRFSFAASSALARQIENGGLADIFISADTDWMDYLQKRGLIQNGTRKGLLSNHLVLIAPKSSTISLKIEPGFALAGALGRDGRLAIADPDYVPAGRYARQSLMTLGIWNSVADRLVRAEDVRATLVFVKRGETPLGIVYGTDALIEPGVRVVDTFPDDSHLPIVYPVALIAVSPSPSARAFLGVLESSKAAETFKRFGFIVLN